MNISPRAVLRRIHFYKQVTLSTSETPVKEGLRRNYYNTALLSQVALRSQTNVWCEGLFCSRRGTIAVAIFAESLDAENCLPTEYSGHASAAAATATAAAAV